MGRVPFALGLVLALAAPLVRAQPADVDPARTRARALLEDGARLYDQGEYQPALAKFRAAFQQFPSPKIWFNVGQSCRALGRDLEALEAFERFLAETADVPIETREEARAAITALASRVGAVRIISDTVGASIAIDGQDKGFTPHAAPIRVTPGEHQVVVEKAGLPPLLRRIDVSAGATVEIRAVLAPPPSPSGPAASISSSGGPLASLSHGGQFGLLVRADVGIGQEVGWRLAPGLSYGLGDRLELAATALLGKQTRGAWAGARYFLAAGAWKPHLTAGVPVFFLDGDPVAGGQIGAGLSFDWNRHLGVAAEVAGAYFPTIDRALGRAWLLPSLSAQARF